MSEENKDWVKNYKCNKKIANQYKSVLLTGRLPRTSVKN